MAVNVPVRLLNSGEVAPKERAWVERALIQPLNQFLGPVRQLLDRGISLQAHAHCQLVTLTLMAPNSGTATDWTAPTFLNSWANTSAGGDFYTTAYRRNAEGAVQVRGLITGGAVPSVAFVLPEGFRPAHEVRLPINVSGTYGAVNIEPDGDFRIAVGTGNFHLNSLTVWADSVEFDWSDQRIDVRSTLRTPCVGLVPLLGEKLDSAGKTSKQVPLGTPAWTERADGKERLLRLIHQPGLLAGERYRLTYLAIGE